MRREADRTSEGSLGSLVKIRFDLDASDWHGHGSETLWAERLCADGREVFLIRNSPFFVRGINHLDLVEATAGDQRGIHTFGSVVERGGHSTYMVLFEPDDRRVSSQWMMLEDAGCSFESMALSLSIGQRILYSVDVPARANLTDVYAALAQGEAMGLWMFQEGHAHVSSQGRGPLQQN